MSYQVLQTCAITLHTVLIFVYVVWRKWHRHSPIVNWIPVSWIHTKNLQFKLSTNNHISCTTVVSSALYMSTMSYCVFDISAEVPRIIIVIANTQISTFCAIHSMQIASCMWCRTYRRVSFSKAPQFHRVDMFIPSSESDIYYELIFTHNNNNANIHSGTFRWPANACFINASFCAMRGNLPSSFLYDSHIGHWMDIAYGCRFIVCRPKRAVDDNDDSRSIANWFLILLASSGGLCVCLCPWEWLWRLCHHKI